MEVFLISGSNANSIRTNTSLLMAFGLKLLGLETVHIQLTGRDERPVLTGEMPAPFATAWFPATERPPSSAAIWKTDSGPAMSSNWKAGTGRMQTR